MQQSLDINVFLSYAQEDVGIAERLYDDLLRVGASVWFAKHSLVAGQRWRAAIRDAIEGSTHFVAMLSNRSVSKRGFVQRELGMALDELGNFPASQI